MFLILYPPEKNLLPKPQFIDLQSGDIYVADLHQALSDWLISRTCIKPYSVGINVLRPGHSAVNNTNIISFSRSVQIETITIQTDTTRESYCLSFIIIVITLPGRSTGCVVMAGHGGAEVELVLGSMQTFFTAVTVGSKGCGAEDAEL